MTTRARRRARRAAPPRAIAVRETAKEPTDRTDDPVRMYLREMGSVELLSREGEIAIAKRIEAGRDTMIRGLCESPLTFEAIMVWRDELVEGRVLLRDIIDLEATYGGPDGRARRSRGGAEGRCGPRAAGPPVAAAPSPGRAATLRRRARGSGGGDDAPAERRRGRRLREQRLALGDGGRAKPRVLETLDAIADNYKKLRRLQDEQVEQRLQIKQLTPAQERNYKELKDDIVQRREVAVAQQQPHRGAGRAALRHQQAPGRA